MLWLLQLLDSPIKCIIGRFFFFKWMLEITLANWMADPLTLGLFVFPIFSIVQASSSQQWRISWSGSPLWWCCWHQPALIPNSYGIESVRAWSSTNNLQLMMNFDDDQPICGTMCLICLWLSKPIQPQLINKERNNQNWFNPTKSTKLKREMKGSEQTVHSDPTQWSWLIKNRNHLNTTLSPIIDG